MYIHLMPGARSFRSKVDRIADECLGMRARLLDRAITSVFNAAFDELGVKLSQLNVLVAVAKLEPARPGDVARALHLEQSTLSRNAERLRASGYLEVDPGDDGRSRRYRLTPAGRDLVVEAYPRWREAQRRAERLLGPSGSDALREFTRRRWAAAGGD